MTGLLAVPPSLLTGAPAAPEARTREQIGKAAKEFESSFISVMLSQIFEGTGESDALLLPARQLVRVARTQP